MKQYGIVEIPIHQIRKAVWNYKKDDNVLLDKLVNNIKKNGQVENLIVRETPDGTYEVVNGNHRLDALLRLGYKTVYCVNLGQITEAVAKRIAVETNETRFEADNFELSEILKELLDNYDKIDLLETLPYEENILDRVNDIFTVEIPDYTQFEKGVSFEGFAFDSNIEEEMKEETEDISKSQITTEVICKHCGKKFTY